MKKKTVGFIALAAITFFSLVGTAFSTISWFVASVVTPEYKINGSSAGAYFAYGDGSEQHPFGISIPRHLYNLSWLQYMGQFTDRQYYFELADSVPADGLNMANYVLPPIGTEDNPFVGNFNGQGKIIKNLTVSNDESTIFNSDKHPDNTQVDFTNPEIVGLFGVVGNLGGAYTGSYDSATNSIYDLGISNITVQTKTSKALVGVAAGYVDATISNVAVNESTIDVNTLNTAAVDGTNLTANLSDYGVVGYATDTYKKSIKKIEQNLYDIEIGANAQFNALDSGDATGWGGSINMTDLYHRLLKFKSTDSGSFGSTSGNYYYKRTWTYNPEKTSYTESGGNYNSSAFRYYNTDPKVGVYQIGNRTSTNAFMYLNGGQYITKQYQEYREHTGTMIKYGSTANKLTVNSFTNNSGTLGNTTGDSPALWSVPAGSSGYISTQYYYNDGNSATTYYLYNNNGTLGLTSSTSTRTTWYKRSNANGICYATTNSDNSGYYLTFTGTSWALAPFTATPNTPEVSRPTEAVEEPDPFTETEPQEPTPKPVDYGYQLYYTDGSTRHYITGTNNALGHSTNPFQGGWTWNSSDRTIQLTGTNYYLRPRSGNNTYSLNLSTTNNYRTWSGRTENDDGTFKFYRTRSSGWSTYYRYLQYNNNNGFTISGDQNSSYSTRTDFSYERMASYNGNYYSYDAAFEAYHQTQAYLDYLSEKQDYDAALAEHNAAVTAYNNYLDAVDQWEQYDSQLEQHNTASAASYCLSQDNRDAQNPVIGPEKYIDNAQTTSGMEYGQDNTTYFPLNVVADGSQTDITKYYPKDSNTGYVTVGSRYDANYTWAYDDNTYYRRSNMRVSEYAISNISSSYTPANGFSTIYTLDQSNDVQEIDDPDVYQRYSDSLESLGTILGKNSSNVYGLHFMESTISKDAVVEAKYVMINGHEYTNYQLPVNSIDFNLKEKGYINLFAGMYFSDNDSLFSLHQVIRNNDNTIKEIKEIKEVYTDGVTNHSVIYKYTDNKYSAGYSFSSTSKTPLTPGQDVNAVDLATLQSGYTLAFKTTQLTNHNHDTHAIINSDFDQTNQSGKIFYFEVPMNSGEFCLGSVEGGTGGYLFYLDIGANAAKTQRTTIYEHYKEIRKVFDYPAGIAIVPVSTVADNLENSTTLDDTNTANFLIVAGTSGTITVTRAQNDVEVARTGGLLSGASGAGAKPTLIGDLMWDSEHLQYNIHDPGGSNLSDEITSEDTVTEVRRLQYYDWNVNLNELTITRITDTSTDGGTNWVRDYYQEFADGTSTTVFANMKIYHSVTGVKYATQSDADTINTYVGNDESSVNNTLIFKVTYQEDAGENIIYEWVLEMAIDGNATGRYYIFQDYVFEATLDNGEVVLTVKTLGSKTIKINSTTITQAGQTVTLTPTNP
ncbi:MAG: hypothetical protein IJR08_00165 [Bacilli bacterium]|nr:hypothetical protein [Bacilli bacterium]